MYQINTMLEIQKLPRLIHKQVMKEYIYTFI